MCIDACNNSIRLVFQSVRTTVGHIASGDSRMSTDANDSPASATKTQESIVRLGRRRRSATIIRLTEHVIDMIPEDHSANEQKWKLRCLHHIYESQKANQPDSI